jgi:hypothetical protein
MSGFVQVVQEAVESVPSCSVQLEQPRGQAEHQRFVSTSQGQRTEAITRLGLEEPSGTSAT